MASSSCIAVQLQQKVSLLSLLFYNTHTIFPSGVVSAVFKRLNYFSAYVLLLRIGVSSGGRILYLLGLICVAAVSCKGELGIVSSVCGSGAQKNMHCLSCFSVLLAY